MIAPFADEGADAGQVVGIARVAAEDSRHGVDRVRVQLDDLDVGRTALERLEDVASAAAADDAGAAR